MKWTEPARKDLSVIICETIFKRHLFQFIIIMYIYKVCVCARMCAHAQMHVSVGTLTVQRGYQILQDWTYMQLLDSQHSFFKT